MKSVLPWALYDLANTFFAVAMLSFYFPLWVVEDQGARELSFSIALGISMGCVALIMPLCGALSDATGERMRFLRWTTYGCTLTTMLIGLTHDLPLALVLFGIANLCYQLGTVFYDALLWSVAPPDRIGQTSGFGAAFGYLGSALGLLLLWPFVRWGGHHAAFAPAALFFLLFALPSFLMIREPPHQNLWCGGEPREVRTMPWSVIIRVALSRLAITVRSARAMGGVWRFLWASFFSLNAINTILVFMAVYTRKVMGLTEAQIIQFFVFSQLFAVAGSLMFGHMIPHWGAKRTLTTIWFGWVGALTLVAINPSMRWLWVAGPVIGFCLGATWATGRVMLVELSPKDRLAEMFGLAGLFGRASAILGPLGWGVLVSDPTRYQHAIFLLIGLLSIGLWLLRGVPVPVTETGG